MTSVQGEDSRGGSALQAEMERLFDDLIEDLWPFLEKHTGDGSETIEALSRHVSEGGARYNALLLVAQVTATMTGRIAGAVPFPGGQVERVAFLRSVGQMMGYEAARAERDIEDAAAAKKH